MNASLKRIALLILDKIPFEERDWLPSDHAGALVYRVREVLNEERPKDFKVPADAKDDQGKPLSVEVAWRKDRYMTALAAINESEWMYASNAKKALVGEKIIPEKKKQADDRAKSLA